MKPIIRVENLGKQYRIGHREAAYATLRESLVQAAVSPITRLRRALNRNGNASADSETHIWALKDVSFEVKPGEVVGIIGRNGAGKSTLLKILSRVTEPTAGRVDLYGRVGSLLEVGTGFHPELTGRENISLNGAILGMGRREIEQKFDSIVAFAEIERFLDTPVKRYSSGMYVRLAFAVASHLETEVLLVDEVLAVGDAAFQKKCLGKVGEVMRQGRAVLLVSHNMAAIQNFCTRCVLLEQGRLNMEGEPSEVLAAYNLSTACLLGSVEDLTNHRNRTHYSIPTMRHVRVSCADKSTSLIHMGDDVVIDVAFEAVKPLGDVTFGVQVKNALQAPVFGINTSVVPPGPLMTPVQKGTVSCLFEKIPLMPGIYNVDLYFGSYNQDFDVIHEACQFEVLPANVFKSGKIPPAMSGSVYWPATWTVRAEETEARYARPLRDGFRRLPRYRAGYPVAQSEQDETDERSFPQ